MSEVSVSGESGSAPAATATASPAVTPGTSASSVAAPIAQPQGDGSTASDAVPEVGTNVPEKGPIPFDRHKAIVDDYHKKLDALKWAESLDHDQFRKMKNWYDTAASNPIEFLQRFQEGLSKHPTWGRYLNQAAPPAQEAPEPQPDLVAENGQQVYSASQLKAWQEWNSARQKAEIQNLISPLLQERERSETEKQAQAFAKRWMDELSGLEGFEELRGDIFKRLKEDRRLSPLTAYKRAYAEVYKPKQSQESRQALLAEMNQKAQATTTNPNAASATPKNPRDMSWEEALAWATSSKR